MVVNKLRACSSLHVVIGPAIELTSVHNMALGDCPKNLRRGDLSGQFPATSQNTFFWSIKKRRLLYSLHSAFFAIAMKSAVATTGSLELPPHAVTASAIPDDRNMFKILFLMLFMMMEKRLLTWR